MTRATHDSKRRPTFRQLGSRHGHQVARAAALTQNSHPTALLPGVHNRGGLWILYFFKAEILPLLRQSTRDAGTTARAPQDAFSRAKGEGASPGPAKRPEGATSASPRQFSDLWGKQTDGGVWWVARDRAVGS